MSKSATQRLVESRANRNGKPALEVIKANGKVVAHSANGNGAENGNGKGHVNGSLVESSRNAGVVRSSGRSGPERTTLGPDRPALNGNGQAHMNGNGHAKTNSHGTTTRIRSLVQRDRNLVERCLAGDVPAWSEIYRTFHDSLLVSIRRYLNRAGQDMNLVEEIAARVWYSLIKNDFELLSKFDVSRGCRLSTYLSVVAKNETRVLFRSERRRKTREHLASRPDFSEQALIDSNRLLTDEEFLVTLSQAERAFFLDVLVAAPEERAEAEQAYSTENNWQLRHRIRKKLEQFMSETDS